MLIVPVIKKILSLSCPKNIWIGVVVFSAYKYASIDNDA